jgi:hypothetical protein
MIYSNYNPNYESYKERNLYYKVFAGYLFNELLPAYEQRKKVFFELLLDQIDSDQHFTRGVDLGKPISDVLKELSEDNLHVSFDFHPKQVITGYPDHGEVSDIIIWGEKYFLSIEVKYLTDWSFKKDVKEVQSRLGDIQNHFHKTGTQVILIKEKKWLNNILKLNSPGSNLKLLKENEGNLKTPILFITWEQLSETIKDVTVKQYLMEQLKRE